MTELNEEERRRRVDTGMYDAALKKKKKIKEHMFRMSFGKIVFHLQISLQIYFFTV